MNDKFFQLLATVKRPTTPHEAMRQGAALLDQVNPGWETDIDVDHLDISDEHNCILGQLYGSFYVGYSALFETHGVDSHIVGYFGFDYGTFPHEELGNAWAMEIQDRLAWCPDRLI